MSPPSVAAASAVAATGRLAQPGAAGFARLLQPLLIQAAGEGASAVSLLLDLAADPGDGALALTAWVERATRTLVFATAEARSADGGLAATCTAVFRRG